MNFLAIDTTSDACSVAVQVDEKIIEKHVVKAREHTQILLPMIRDALAESGLAATDLDALLLGNGPGSFIGMRIGASVAQGICHGAGIGIVPVSSMAAVAAQVIQEEGAETVVVAQDARMNEVYVGHYIRSNAGLPSPAREEKICSVGAIADIAPNCLAAGYAWQKYAALIEANKSSISSVSDICVPRASYVMAVGRAAFECDGAIAPELLLPAYLRTKVAEIPQPAN